MKKLFFDGVTEVAYIEISILGNARLFDHNSMIIEIGIASGEVIGGIDISRYI